MNKVFLVGRLAADPVASTTSKGNPQSKITIATSSNRQKDETYFFPCIAWSQPANYINTFLKKGDLVAVDGQLRRTSFVSKQSGQTVYSTDIVIDAINSVGSRKQNNEFMNASNNVQTNSEPKKSIDSVFATNIVTNKESSNQKIETPKYENTNDEIEWFDELNEGDK